MQNPHFAYLEYASEYAKPFVSYRLPNANKHITLILDEKSAAPITDYSQLENRSGFVFTPFDTESQTSYFITPKEVLIGEKGFRGDLFLNKNRGVDKSQLSINKEDKSEYKKQFRKLYNLLEKKELQKVILSRTITMTDFPGEEHAYLYYNLANTYPQAMVYWVHLPHLGIQWMGATPELLLKKQNSTLETLALAGTKKANETWSEKERQEQQIVVDYIKEQLEDYELKTTPTETVNAGNVQHLATHFTLHNVENAFFSIIRKLHPTPAICGLPKSKAFESIQNIEQHNRNYYCGFLGPINIENTTATFVNLRCMQLTQNAVRLYVGGGLTKDSNIEREWQETNRKANTLRKFL